MWRTVLLGWGLATSLLNASILQEAIDRASPGDILRLAPGIYQGAIRIDKPLTIEGQEGRVIIRGEGKGSVIRILASSVTLKGLWIEGSGSEHSSIDAGIVAEKVSNLKILDNRLRDVLFGIDLRETHRSEVSRNHITSKPFDLGLRGDAIRLWYSHDNTISENTIQESRDFVVWYSSGNRIFKNHGVDGRYSLHFMYAGKNLVEDNLFERNSVGIFFMYSEGTTARNNTVKNSVGSFGVGIGMKDASNFTLKENTVIYNARGFYIDQSPFQPGSVNRYEGNRILYNTTGVQFHATQHRSLFYGNLFKGNVETIANDTPGAKIRLNEWLGNYYDDYEGLDRNKDGIGDIPHRHYAYADKLWLYYPALRFFYGSTVMSVLNFLAKLAPFSEPDLLLEDSKPKMEAKF